MKDNIVNVVRYIRNGSNEGITFLFRINYETGVVGAKWSICDGDNFSKKEGIKRAKESKMEPLFFLVAEVDEHKGLVPAVLNRMNMLFSKPVAEMKYNEQAYLFSKLREILLENGE